MGEKVTGTFSGEGIVKLFGSKLSIVYILLLVTHTHTHSHTHTHKPPPGIQSTVRASMEESLFQILSPKHRINILRDVMERREKGGRPYTITFCGVNGVGKSTNLAKVCVWALWK